MGMPSSFFHGGGPPPGFLSSFSNAHKIFFRIKDKSDELSSLSRSRLDSLSEITANDLKRSRTKSAVIQEISSASIIQFMQFNLTNLNIFEPEGTDKKKQKVGGDEIENGS